MRVALPMPDAEPPPALLPHGYPCLLLDRILMVAPGAWAAALKNVTRNDPCVSVDGTWPPVLLAELMAQAAGLAAAPAAAVSAQFAVLGKIDRFRCRKTIAGDQLLVIARVHRSFGANVIVRAVASVAARPRAAAELVLHFPSPGAR